MAIVRYAVLVALVVWLGRLLAAVAGSRLDDLLPWVTYAAGAVIVIGLFVMKFVGPPPHGFVPRVAIVVLMLALTFLDQIYRLTAAKALTLALGFALLAWYGRE